MSLTCICIFYLIITTADNADGSGDADMFIAQEKKLFHALFDNHEVEMRPVQDYNDTLDVKFDMAVYHFDMDEGKQVITLGFWGRQKWQNYELQWNPEDYSGIKEIQVPADKVWKPDILPYFMVKNGLNILQDVSLKLSYDGSLHWFPPVSLTFPCVMDMRYFPWDTHTCMLTVGSWTYLGNQLNVTVSDDETTAYLPNKKDRNWILDKISVKRTEHNFEDKSYISLIYNLNLTRNSAYFIWLFVTPIIFLALLTPFTLIIPPNAQQKITMGGCLLIALTIMILVIISSIPTAHGRTPLLGIFVVINFVVMAVSLAVSCLVSNMFIGLKPDHFPPEIIRKVILRGLGRLFCLTPAPTYKEFKDEQAMANVGQQGTASSSVDVGKSPASLENPDNIFSPTCFPGKGRPQGASLEWLCIATIIDRLLFLGFLVFLIVLIIAIMHG